MLSSDLDRLYHSINRAHSRLSTEGGDGSVLLLVRMLAELVEILSRAESRYNESANDPTTVKEITRDLVSDVQEALGNYVAWLQ